MSTPQVSGGREEKMDKRLYRSRRERMVFGVCGGLADYFNVDPAIVRIVFVLLALIPPHGIGLIAYIVLAIVVPEEGTQYNQPSEVVKQNLDNMGRSAGQLGEELRATFADERDTRTGERNRNLAGLILIVLGALFLLGNLGPIWWFNLGFLWPLIMVAIGLALIFGWQRR